MFVDNDLFYYMFQRTINRSMENVEFEPKTKGLLLTSNIIKKICTMDQKEFINKPCVICLDNMTDKVGKILCGHVFHYRCIDRWIRSSASCPVCRCTFN